MLCTNRIDVSQLCDYDFYLSKLHFIDLRKGHQSYRM